MAARGGTISRTRCWCCPVSFLRRFPLGGFPPFLGGFPLFLGGFLFQGWHNLAPPYFLVGRGVGFTPPGRSCLDGKLRPGAGGGVGRGFGAGGVGVGFLGLFPMFFSLLVAVAKEIPYGSRYRSAQ